MNKFYSALPFSNDIVFDTELISKIILDSQTR